MAYRINWFENERLIGTEVWDDSTLESAKVRARLLVATTTASRAEVRKPNGEIVFDASGDQSKG